MATASVRRLRFAVRHEEQHARPEGRSIAVTLDSEVGCVVTGLHLQSPGLSLAHEQAHALHAGMVPTDRAIQHCILGEDRNQVFFCPVQVNRIRVADQEVLDLLTIFRC